MVDSMDIDSEIIQLPIQSKPTNPTEVTKLVHRIVRQDLNAISEECWEVFEFCVQNNKLWPNDGIDTCKDPSVTNSIRNLDSIITDATISDWKRRIAYMRLAELFDRLVQPVKADRKRRRLEAKPGSKVPGSAYYVFQRAVKRQATNAEIRKNVRTGKRYQTLLKGSPLLSIAYCNNADKMIRDFSVTPKILERLGKAAVETVLAQISDASPNFQQLIAKAVSEQYNAKQMRDAFKEFIADPLRLQQYNEVGYSNM
ncbi:hypothetical protein GGR55DRAFT_625002 [Xylaria sp. FL0064]|nr:hypothetical protein GGR55DRAFT_625002 [Xylaria sp. FL0064]